LPRTVGRLSLTRRTFMLLTFLVVVLAACGGGDDEEVEEVASLSDTGASAGVETEGRVSFEEAVLGFTSCMRENGVDIPDLQVDAEGQPRLPTGALAGIDTTSPEFTEAFVSCVGILTDAGAVSLSTDPELLGVIRDQLRDFSACMRSNGLPQFPDPNPNFDGSGSPYPLSAINPSDPNLSDALEVCQDLLAFPAIGG
jgi:hypothetical protein